MFRAASLALGFTMRQARVYHAAVFFLFFLLRCIKRFIVVFFIVVIMSRRVRMTRGARRTDARPPLYRRAARARQTRGLGPTDARHTDQGGHRMHRPIHGHSAAADSAWRESWPLTECTD